MVVSSKEYRRSPDKMKVGPLVLTRVVNTDLKAGVQWVGASNGVSVSMNETEPGVWGLTAWTVAEGGPVAALKAVATALLQAAPPVPPASSSNKAAPAAKKTK